MGTTQLPTWCVLFALFANAASVAGMPLAPSDQASATVCDAQAAIARMMAEPAPSGQSPASICALQSALGEFSGVGQTRQERPREPVPAVAVRHRQTLDGPGVKYIPSISVLDCIASGVRSSSAKTRPACPWSVPLPRQRYLSLLTPHAPPCFA